MTLPDLLASSVLCRAKELLLRTEFMEPNPNPRLVSLLLICWSAVSLSAAEPNATPRYRIAYATYLGGSQWDQAREVIVYPDGSVLVGAQAVSDEMPTTAGVVQPKYAGDDPRLGHGGVYGGDCYLARISADGDRLLAATYFGGSKQERNVYGMALDSQGNVVITSATRSPDAATTPGCFQPRFGVVRLTCSWPSCRATCGG